MLFPNGALDRVNQFFDFFIVFYHVRQRRQPLAGRAAQASPRFFFERRAGGRGIAFAIGFARTAFGAARVNAEFFRQPFANAPGGECYFFSASAFAVK